MSRNLARCFSSTATVRAATSSSIAAAPAPDARWLSQSTSRIGTCLTSSCTESQTTEAGALLKELSTDWRELVAGSEGYLTGESRRGLWRHGVVWGEQFPGYNGHVNNVTYVRYAESARINWMANYANAIDPANRDGWEELCTARGTGLILRSIKVDFKFPMTYPDKVTVFHKLHSLPESKHDCLFFDVLMLSEKHRRPVARAVEDVVLYDYRKGKKTSLDTRPFMLERFRETFELQEQAVTQNRGRALKLGERITALEKSMWE